LEEEEETVGILGRNWESPLKRTLDSFPPDAIDSENPPESSQMSESSASARHVLHLMPTSNKRSAINRKKIEPNWEEEESRIDCLNRMIDSCRARDRGNDGFHDNDDSNHDAAPNAQAVYGGVPLSILSTISLGVSIA